jgi:hypothetical protein
LLRAPFGRPAGLPDSPGAKRPSAVRIVDDMECSSELEMHDHT